MSWGVCCDARELFEDGSELIGGSGVVSDEAGVVVEGSGGAELDDECCDESVGLVSWIGSFWIFWGSSLVGGKLGMSVALVWGGMTGGGVRGMVAFKVLSDLSSDGNTTASEAREAVLG